MSSHFTMNTAIPLFGSHRINPIRLILIVWVCCAPALTAQRLQNISLSATGGIVRIDFSVIKGSNCDGYKILHSLDSTFFSVVGDYAGICSDPFVDVQHSYNHSSPQPNAVNFYKIELPFVETSDIYRVYVSADGRPLLLPFPNPVPQSDGLIRFRSYNTENGLLEGFVCDESGHQFKRLLLNSSNYIIELPLQGLSTGIYFVWLSDGLLVYGCKFIVSP